MNNKNQEPQQYSQLIKYSAPLPPPNLLSQYDKVIPNGAERIFNSFEEQTKHRQKLESKLIESQVKRAERGQILGFILAILALCIAGVLIFFDHNLAGTLFGSVTVISLVGYFVTGHLKKSKNETKEENKSNSDKKDNDQYNLF